MLHSWLVCLGVLLFLFSSQQVMDILSGDSNRSTPGLRVAFQPDVSKVSIEPEPLEKPQVTSPARDPVDVPAASFIPSVRSPRTAMQTGASGAPKGETKPVSSSPDRPQVEPGPPTRLVIPAIQLDASVQRSESRDIQVGGHTFQQWEAPGKFAAGWHTDSALPGEPGNTVLNGHHNKDGEVFRRVKDLSVGDEIRVYSFEGVFGYQVTNKMILPEKYQHLDVRITNAQWILPSQDERLTLVTCWPYESNTHRLIVVARLVYQQPVERELQ